VLLLGSVCLYFIGKNMKIILFSREDIVIDHWKEKLNSSSSSKYSNIISCASFAELGEAISDKDHILLFHLEQGESEEKICYQFITKYQQQQQMIVFTNKPEATQGLRIFRSGVYGYTNTYLGKDKLLVAIDVIEQGKIWIGAETLNRLLSDCGLDSNNDTTEKLTKDLTFKKNPASNEKKNSLLDSLFKGVKKLFG
jgi:DNA-binding NarL/FixJ family response regulator